MQLLYDRIGDAIAAIDYAIPIMHEPRLHANPKGDG